jgi:hypothetical protein
LQRVLRSDAFRNSESLRHLLEYLGERSLTEPVEDIKEYTIGVEACGKPSSYDPQRDASVRVQLGRLRQKLNDYYAAEGASDPLILELPKGRFILSVRPKTAESASGTVQERQTPIGQASSRRMTRLSAALACLLIASLSGSAYLWIRLQKGAPQLAEAAEVQRAFSPLWGPFLKRQPASTAIFGSPPFFASGKYSLFVRLYGQTNPEDARSSPDFGEVDSKVGPLSGPRFDYASMGDAIAVQRLTAFLARAGVSLNALPAHVASWETVKDGNLIFVGASRMHPMLRRLPIVVDFELGADNQVHNRNPQSGEQQIYRTPSHRDAMTYAVVGLFPGLKPGREVFVITAHSSPGAEGAADFITGAESVQLLAQRVGLSAAAPRKYFQALLRVHVDNDVAVKTEYVTHHVLPIESAK